jgi:glucose-1-phosphatase
MNKDRIILFDLSGVLVELGGMPDFVKWTGKSTEDIGIHWLKSESVRDFERGNISFEEFYSIFVTEWKVKISYQELFESFESWVERAFPGAIDLLSELKNKYTLACLTNTNSVQWPVVRQTIEADKYFDYQFASHLMGKVKPDAEAYLHVVDTLGVSPDRIVFFDDSIMNVNSASYVGIKSIHVKGVDSVRDSLLELGLRH